jgi:polysaccharide chain length determinant protein (PEP-CTERM system associated)
MDFGFVLQFIKVVFREIWQSKLLALFVFTLVIFVVLVIGMRWPSKFATSATIYADNQNILGPLLENQAEQTRIEDHAKVVTDMLQSPRMLTRVANSLYLEEVNSSPAALAGVINRIRDRVDVSNLASGYIKISYSDSTAEGAYQGLNAIVDVFIRSSAEEQRTESREAFKFIDNQVQQYKDQLVLAEQRLKEFSSLNFDGRDSDVNASIARIRAQIDDLEISIDEDHITESTLEKQLSDESEFAAIKAKNDIYAERLQQLEERLSALLLSYTDDYPDVVSLRYQIDDLRKTMREAAAEKEQGGSSRSVNSEDVLLNPLYQELRSRLSQVRTDMKAKEKRLSVLNELLQEEFERRKRIAARAAEEAELTRDYNVTRQIYEDMLERKEKARLSMTLNIEGQGVTYRIQEPPVVPLSPSGLRFLHFVLLGPIVGLVVVLGAAVALVMLDPRIRFVGRLADLEAPLLAVVPHVSTPLSRRVLKVDMLVCIGISLVVMVLYVSLAYAIKIGVV